MTKSLIVKESAISPPDENVIVIDMADLKEYIPPAKRFLIRKFYSVYNTETDQRGMYVHTTA